MKNIKAVVSLQNRNRYSVKRSIPMQKIGKHSATAFIFTLLLFACHKEDVNPNQLGCWGGDNIVSNNHVTGCVTYNDYKKLKDFNNTTWTAITD